MKTVLAVIGSLFGLIVLVAVIGRLSENTKPALPRVQARVRHSVTTLYVTNEEKEDWGSATIYLNGVIGGYTKEIGPVKAGKTVAIPLMLFTKGGRRYQPLSEAVDEVLVSVPGYEIAAFRVGG